MDFLSRTDERGIALGLLLALVTVLAWLGVVRADAAMEMSHGPAAFSLGAMATFTAEWGVMMAAMMLPSAAPMILLYRGASRRMVDGARALPAELFALTYVAMWLATGVPVYAASVAVAQAAARSVAFAVVLPYAIAGSLLAAGVYQLSPAKRACLRQCESPVNFLMRRWKSGYGATLRLAVTHAAYCIGCCWALMLVLVVAGSMSLPWVLAISLAVFAEKVLPGGERTARVIGLALIVAGVAVAISVTTRAAARSDPRDESAEFLHEVAQEFLRGLVRHDAVVRDHVLLELDVGFRRIHQRRVAEGEHAAQVLLGDGSSDLAGRSADDGRRLPRERVFPIGSARPIDRVLESAGDRAVVLGRHEQDSVHA